MRQKITNRKAERIVVVLAWFLVGCCPEIPALDLPVPADLPEMVYFRTANETFNQDYFLVLREGRIWYKPKAESKGGWKLLGKTGRPEGCGLVRHPLPDRIVAISGDGVHLMALSDRGVFYRGTNLRTSTPQGLEWTDKWGWPMADGPGLTMPFGLASRWAVSDAHTFDLKYYEDGNGTRHHIGLGVAHLYLLGEDGISIFFNDWWLPADWSREICGPWRGTFRAKNVTASGSTLAVINDAGSLYTRMYDFDISGENPFLTYTYTDKHPASNVRKLPMPDWERQPAIQQGRITATISITQTGEGNAAREIRIEGEKDGKTGFFSKGITSKTWVFQETSLPLQEPLLSSVLEPEPLEPRNPDERSLQGRLAKEGIAEPLRVEIPNFHLVCSPAFLRVFHRDTPITAKGKELRLPFHHVHTLVTHRREIKSWKKGVAADIRAAIVIPPEIDEVEDTEAKARLQAFFHGLHVVHLGGEALETRLSLSELTVWDMFRAPDHEKGFTSRFSLSAETSPR